MRQIVPPVSSATSSVPSRVTASAAGRVPFKDGRPEGYYENFVTGFWVSGERRAEVWGMTARNSRPSRAEPTGYKVVHKTRSRAPSSSFNSAM